MNKSNTRIVRKIKIIFMNNILIAGIKNLWLDEASFIAFRIRV